VVVWFTERHINEQVHNINKQMDRQPIDDMIRQANVYSIMLIIRYISEQWPLVVANGIPS